jgi:hypothetical protein
MWNSPRAGLRVGARVGEELEALRRRRTADVLLTRRTLNWLLADRPF